MPTSWSDDPYAYYYLEGFESLLKSQPRSRIGSFLDWLSRTYRDLSFALLGEMEPRVWEYVDRTGQSWWVIQNSLADEPF